MVKIYPLLMLFLSICLSVCAEQADEDSLTTVVESHDSIVVDMMCDDSLRSVVRRPWLAAAECVGLHAALLSVDRFIIDGDYAHVTMSTVSRNIKMRHWWYDVDEFYTNCIHHPYHGSLYYNAARSNGMGIGASALYATGGSLLWELMGENELPSVNDMLATPAGGVAIGEVLHQFSRRLLSRPSYGVERVGREIAAALVNPAQAVTRMLTGEMFRRKSYCDYEKIADGDTLTVLVSGGWRRLTSNVTVDGLGRHTALTLPYLSLHAERGMICDSRRTRPYDWFTTDFTLTGGKGQQVINEARVVAQLYGIPIAHGKRQALTVGIYQHFGYYASSREGNNLPGDFVPAPYELCEAASAGLGMAYCWQHTSRLRTEQAVWVNGVALGGITSDYPNDIDNRDYHFGSGFNVKLHGGVFYSNRFMMIVDAENHHLYTRLDCGDVPSLRSYAQGHRGSANVWHVRSGLYLRLWQGLGISATAIYHHRSTHYTYKPYRSAHAWDIRAGIACWL
ncbi:MAG: DUF3943 domain-containing protein [Prevotella sp.]|nr:DUF3943 domain-containing protein [Prevotella sp.]